MPRWNCSQVENEEDESWQEGDHMAEQREEEQHLEEVARRRMEESSIKIGTHAKSTRVSGK